MALGFQARAMRKGLVKLGGPSLLAGIECGHVVIERNVFEFAGIGNTADDNSAVRHTIASIDVAFNPRVAQTLVHPDGTFVLDRKIEDNGVVARFIVVAA